MTEVDYNLAAAWGMLERLHGGGLEGLEAVDEGPCDQCDRSFARARVRYGRFLLCRVCAQQRARLWLRIKEAA